MCVRNEDGGDKISDLPLEHFDVELWNRIAEYDTRGWTVHEITLNGNWGDPIMHKDLDKMLWTWTKYHPETALYLHTNGSLRSTDWWTNFAHTTVQFPEHRVVVAVDGLADTHAIYRQDTDFEKIKENCMAFTSAGGVLEIVTTMFEHNKHQIDDIVAEIETWGATTFEARHSHGESVGPIQAYRDRAPFREKFKFIPPSAQRDSEFYNEHRPNYHTPENQNLSKCPWYNDAKIQIDPWGNVWPCCHISLLRMHKYDSEAEKINLNDNNLYDILAGHWYKDVLHDGINGKNPWDICKRKCGV